MKTLFTRIFNAFCWLAIIASVWLILESVTNFGTKRVSKRRICLSCMAERYTVFRTFLWRVVEDRDNIVPLPGNEDFACNHDWVFTDSGESWGLLFKGRAAGSRQLRESERTKIQRSIEENEKRTGRSYAKE